MLNYQIVLEIQNSKVKSQKYKLKLKSKAKKLLTFELQF